MNLFHIKKGVAMRRITLSALTFAVATTLLLAQDGQKVKIENALPQGQKATVTMESVMELSLVADSSVETRVQDVKLITKEKFQHEVVLPDRVKIVCESSSTMRNAEEIKSPATGKTFFVETSGGKRSVQTDEGKAFTDPIADHLGRWLDVGLVLPPNEVSKGDSWQSDVTALVKTVNFNYELPSLQVQCTLDEVADNQATISFKWEYQGKTKTKELKSNIKGNLVMDLEKKRAVKISFQGSFTVTEDIIEVGRNINDRTSEQTKVGTAKVDCRRFSTTVTLDYN
jgi:hypothetical protein